MYTITVGKKPSKAHSYLESPIDVKNLLEAFMHVSLKRRLSISSYDLRSLGLTNDSTLELSNSSEKNFHQEFIGSEKNDV